MKTFVNVLAQPGCPVKPAIVLVGSKMDLGMTGGAWGVARAMCMSGTDAALCSRRVTVNCFLDHVL